MKNKLIQNLMLLVFINSYCLGQWISIEKNSVPDSKPIVQLLSDDITETIIKIELPGFRITEFNNNGKVYQSIDIGAIGKNSEVGMPDIPYISKVLAIPNQGTVDAEVIEVSKAQIIEGINLPPVRKSWMEGEPETPYIENSEVYSSELKYPREFVKVEDPAIFRDFRIARVSIFPLRYSPAKKQIEVISSITIRIKYGSGLGLNPKLTSQTPIAPSFAKLYKSFIFNYNSVLQREYRGMEEGHDIMLCIMPDLYIEEFQPYAEWKNKSGTEIFVIKFSDIGANQNDPDIIRNYILGVYNTWENTPTHVLIIGDKGTPVGNAPVKYWTGMGWTFVSEDYFVELEGNDYFPEMMIGRLTNYNGTTGGGEYLLQVMVDKFLKYEKTPYTANTDWYKKATVCSNNAFQSQVETKRFAAQILLESGFTSVDTMMSNYQCTYDEGDIVAALNNGRSFLNYRGEGWSDGWHASCYYFSTSYVNSLNNANKLTFVTSIGCGVAMFDEGNCFGETWIEKGSLTSPPTGACAFLGPTSNTHTAYNNYIDKGIYIGMFQEGLDSPGEALLRGKLYMYENFGGIDPYVEYHYKIYCCLGDPSMHIWKNIPQKVNVSYTDTINVGLSQCQVTVTDSSSGLPVANVLVCVSGDSVYQIAFTQSDGTAIIDINTTSIGDLDFTVSGGIIIPFEGIIHVVENTNTFQLTVSVTTGWNMVSVPGTNPDGMEVDTWWAYRDPLANVFKYAGSYQSVTTTTPGIGYWLKHSDSRVYNTGDEWPSGGMQIVSHNPLTGFAGWNLIGGYDISVSTAGITTNPPGLQQGAVYKYSGGYQQAASLDPGYGYWIKLTGAGQIIIPETLAKGDASEFLNENLSADKSSWGKMVLADATGIHYTLYAVKGDVDLDQYELPPAPPEGMFDIRFESGRIAEDINSSVKTIDLSGVTYPLTVKAENMDIWLMDETGKIVNVNLKKGEDVVISDATIQKLMVTGELKPDKYSLEQNYPNPFNPSTVIEFSLPENVDKVSLTIFNTLGEKITELVNTSLQSGRYSYEWNAKDVATGIYFYQLKTDKFISIRKMVLIK